MLRKLARNILAIPVTAYPKPRLAHYDTSERFRVTIAGAAGGIGQPLSLLLRLHPLISTLTLYDLNRAKGIAVDLSHIDRPGQTRGFEGKEELIKAMKCTDIVVVPAGLPRKPGQSREDLFDANAKVIAEIADAVGMVSPEAFLAIITNPVNSTVPIAAEVLKKRNVYDAGRLFGITTLDVVRARKFISEAAFLDPRRIKIPIIGGHSGKTIVPLISQMEPKFKADDNVLQRVTKRIQEGGTEVVEAKKGAGSATLSMAHAAALFVDSLLLAKEGKRKEIREIAYVESCLTPAQFFASEIMIGTHGIVDVLPLPELSPYEEGLMCEAMPVLLDDVEKGIQFGEAYESDLKMPESECQESEQSTSGDKPAQPPKKK